MTGSTPSPVLLGLPANLYSSARGAVQTTPLIQSPANPTFYYLSLKGSTGGTVIDSGTSVTMLPPQVYLLLRDAFVSQMKLPTTSIGDLQLCFTVPPQTKLDVPNLALHFEGATLDLQIS
uniref:Peptidase A1 domain-containing protein n=1 Tax=Arundo donax TaxID=35708 RepID=A0A0A9FU06_ARUDO